MNQNKKICDSDSVTCIRYIWLYYTYSIKTINCQCDFKFYTVLFMYLWYVYNIIFISYIDHWIATKKSSRQIHTQTSLHCIRVEFVLLYVISLLYYAHNDLMFWSKYHIVSRRVIVVLYIMTIWKKEREREKFKLN